ncbi:methyltransferase domain-containing protein [Candidatus Sumerlaeota bacterium]|nr:methyltransferase domain-containing protein [Candidatus Sumerlaeota bacterium]
MDFTTLSADAAHRFRAVAQLLHRHGQTISATRPRLLDVGGYPGTFAREFTTAYPRWQAITLDQPKENLPQYVSASGSKIPFPDGSFDAVVSIDTFEHVPPAERELFLSELCRVSGGVVILAAPFHHDSVATVEQLLDTTHQKLFNVPHPWLHEHVQNGLPQLMKTIGAWPVNFGLVEVKQSYELQAWVTWQALSLFRKLKGEVDKSWQAFDAASAASPAPTPSSVPYRWILVGRRGEHTIDLPVSITAPAGTGQEVIELTRLYCRMMEVVAAETTSRAELGATLVVEERLKQAILATEQQLAQAKVRPRSASSDIVRRPHQGGITDSIYKLFKR